MGLSAAQAFAAEGAAVALVDTNESAVRTAAEKLAASGHKAIAVRCDVSDEAQVKAMVEQTVATFAVWMPRLTMRVSKVPFRKSPMQA